MPKAKVSAGGDFVKKRGKLGKKKLAPTNATSTAFKAQSVTLLSQVRSHHLLERAARWQTEKATKGASRRLRPFSI